MYSTFSLVQEKNLIYKKKKMCLSLADSFLEDFKSVAILTYVFVVDREDNKLLDN